MALLVMRRGGLGDTLLMLPLLRCLRRAHPGAALHFAGVPEFAEPFLVDGVVDAVHSIEDFALWSPDTARSRLSQFERVIGDVPELASTALDPRALAPGEPAGLQLARMVGFEPRWPEDSWLLPPRRSPTSGPVMLAPGSGGRAKCAPRERWLELARELSPEPCLVVVGPVERERDDPRAWPWPEGTGFFADGTVAQLAGAMQEARAYFGNDSGTTHLAAMLGAPTTAFFTATDPSVWAPVGPHVRVVSDADEGDYSSARRTRRQ